MNIVIKGYDHPKDVAKWLPCDSMKDTGKGSEWTTKEHNPEHVRGWMISVIWSTLSKLSSNVKKSTMIQR